MFNQASINENDFTLFKKYIADNCGIIIPHEKTYLIETRLSKYIADAGVSSFGELYYYLISNKDPSLPQKIINAITVSETQWFRDASPWKVLEDRILPALINELVTGKKSRIRIWSTAVSTGQEIYSTVMCIDNYIKKNNIKGVTLSDFDFFATDISNRVLDIAKKGRYDRISIMRGLDDYYKSKYFAENSLAWDIDAKIRDTVRFEHFNLQNDFAGFGQFDIIFCRYVLIYFSDELKREIISKIYNSLPNGGILFTGIYALFDLFKDDYNIEHFENLTYYSKGDVQK